MKSLVLGLLVVLSGTGAFGQVADSDLVSCHGHRGTPRDVRFLLFPAGAKRVFDVEEKISVPYRLVLKKGELVWLDVKVMASHEDVMFQYKHRSSKYGNVEGIIYLDELYETSVTVNGTRFNFNCGSEEFDLN